MTTLNSTIQATTCIHCPRGFFLYMDDDGQHVGAHKLLLLLLCDNVWWFNQLTYLQVMFGIKNNSQNKPYVSIDIY